MYIQPLPLFVLVASAVLSMGVAPVYAPPPARPPETRLADHCDQLGIDSTPRFGWVVNDLERGERRSAYQIQVAANPNELTGKKALFGQRKDEIGPVIWHSYAGSGTYRFTWQIAPAPTN